MEYQRSLLIQRRSNMFGTCVQTLASFPHSPPPHVPFVIILFVSWLLQTQILRLRAKEQKPSFKWQPPFRGNHGCRGVGGGGVGTRHGWKEGRPKTFMCSSGTLIKIGEKKTFKFMLCDQLRVLDGDNWSCGVGGGGDHHGWGWWGWLPGVLQVSHSGNSDHQRSRLKVRLSNGPLTSETTKHQSTPPTDRLDARFQSPWKQTLNIQLPESATEYGCNNRPKKAVWRTKWEQQSVRSGNIG